MTKSTREYQKLSRKAMLWDSLPFHHIDFKGRVIEKYGKDYFKERYSYITGDFYKNIKRTSLDSVDKIIGLSLANNRHQDQIIEDNQAFIKLMTVPEEYKEIWKNTIPLRYYNDYKDRKFLLDSYLKTLSPEEQARAIKTMCLNNTSKNYLAFLDLQEDQMTLEQQALFERLVKFYEDSSFDENAKKEELAKKSLESIELSIKNEQTNENVNEFLLKKDLENEDANYIHMIENNDKELDFFKSKDLYDDTNYGFTNAGFNLNVGNLRDQFNKDEFNTQQQVDAYMNSLRNDIESNRPKQNYRVYSASGMPLDDASFANNNQFTNNFGQPQINSQSLRDNFVNDTNKFRTINEKPIDGGYFDLNNLNNLNKNFANTQNLNDYQNQAAGINFANIQNQRKQQFQRQNYQSNINYKQYIKSPSVYNIVDLINNREIEAANNREVVDQIVQSTIQVNNQYVKQDTKYKSPIVNNKLVNTASMNNVPIVQTINKNNIMQSATNKPQFDPTQMVPLSQIKNQATRRENLGPLEKNKPISINDQNPYTINTKNPFDLSNPDRYREQVNLNDLVVRKQGQNSNQTITNTNNKSMYAPNNNQYVDYVKSNKPSINLNLRNDNLTSNTPRSTNSRFNYEPNSVVNKKIVDDRKNEIQKAETNKKATTNVPVVKRKVARNTKSTTARRDSKKVLVPSKKLV